MNLIGGHPTPVREGRELRRFGPPMNSAIKQVASGRFVTPAYLHPPMSSRSRWPRDQSPAKGGQLPGHKVSAEIARLRYTEPGVTL